MRDLFEADTARRLTRAGAVPTMDYGDRRWRLPDTGITVTEDEALRWLDRQTQEAGGEGGHE